MLPGGNDFERKNGKKQKRRKEKGSHQNDDAAKQRVLSETEQSLLPLRHVNAFTSH